MLLSPGYSSGQRGVTVSHVASPSQVRILVPALRPAEALAKEGRARIVQRQNGSMVRIKLEFDSLSGLLISLFTRKPIISYTKPMDPNTPASQPLECINCKQIQLANGDTVWVCENCGQQHQPGEAIVAPAAPAEAPSVSPAAPPIAP